jgi:hypothetical protein
MTPTDNILSIWENLKAEKKLANERGLTNPPSVDNISYEELKKFHLENDESYNILYDFIKYAIEKSDEEELLQYFNVENTEILTTSLYYIFSDNLRKRVNSEDDSRMYSEVPVNYEDFGLYSNNFPPEFSSVLDLLMLLSKYNIYWHDLHSENIMVGKYDKEIKIVDVGYFYNRTEDEAAYDDSTNTIGEENEDEEDEDEEYDDEEYDDEEEYDDGNDEEELIEKMMIGKSEWKEEEW